MQPDLFQNNSPNFNMMMMLGMTGMNPMNMVNMGNMGNIDNMGNMGNMNNMPNMGNMNNMPNMGNMNNMGNMGNINNMPNMGNMQNDILGSVYGSGQNINQGNQVSFQKERTNIYFKTTGGLSTMLSVDSDKPLSYAILIYLKRVNREYLYKENSGILFIYNAQKINIYNDTPIGLFFGGLQTPVIMVNDVKNLIGALKK